MNGMMQTVVIIVVVLVIAGLLKKALRRKGVSAKAASSYEKTDGLMSPAELCFFRVLEVVVADDKQSRQTRDELVDSILDEAGIPVFHFPARASYSAPEIRSCLFGTE